MLLHELYGGPRPLDVVFPEAVSKDPFACRGHAYTVEVQQRGLLERLIGVVRSGEVQGATAQQTLAEVVRVCTAEATPSLETVLCKLSAIILGTSAEWDALKPLQQHPAKFIEKLQSELKIHPNPTELGVLFKQTGLLKHSLILRLCDEAFLEKTQQYIDEIEARVEEGVFEDEVAGLRSFIAGVFGEWFVPLLCLEEAADRGAHYTRLELIVLERLGRTLCKSFFDVTVTYPDSRDTLLSLKACLVAVPTLYPHLVSSAREQIEKRLLQAGAFTEDAIEVYINTLNAVDTLFPSQPNAMDSIATVMEEFLRRRRDGAALFVTGLINDDSSRLAAVLHPEFHVRGKEEDASMTEQMHVMRKLDVLKRLVHTFGGREYVVSLYRGVLAERLLTRQDFDADSEITALELLKIRFGEAPLQNCEVMLRDMADSKRFFQVLEKERGQTTTDRPQHSALIQSHLYWPKASSVNGLVVHPYVAQLQEEFAEEFQKRKEPRKFRVYTGVGNVTLEVSLWADASKQVRETQSVTCSILQASLLLHLADAEKDSGGASVPAAVLSALSGIEAAQVDAKMGFWTGLSFVLHDAAGYSCAQYKTKSGPSLSQVCQPL